MFLYTRKDYENIILDLSGTYEWIHDEEFKRNILTLADQKYLLLISDEKIDEKIELQYDSDHVHTYHMVIFDVLDTDESGVLVITNNPEHATDWILSGYSVVYLMTEGAEEYDQFEIMPDEIWNIKDFNEFVQNPEFRKTHFSELLGFPNEPCNIEKFQMKKRTIPNTNYHCNVLFTGRYFTLHDNRSYIHPLSRAIIGFKNNLDTFEIAVKKMFGKLIDTVLNNYEEVHTICVVPPRPGKTSRFLGIEKYTKYKIDYDLLFTKEDYKSPKNYIDFFEKYQCVYNKIGINKKVNGHVLIIDDVFTSGATTIECARVLYENGASEVTILPIAFTQEYDYEHQYKVPVVFNSSGNEYNLRLRKDDFQAYWTSKNQDNTYTRKNYGQVRYEYIENYGAFGTKYFPRKESINYQEIQAILFDLDNTLVETDHLENYRKDTYTLNELTVIEQEKIIISPEILERLKNLNVKIGIVTTSPKKYATKILDLVGYHYDYIVASKDTLRSKPYPDPFIKCSKKLNVDSYYTIVIGDNEKYDIQGGENAGMCSFLIQEVMEYNILEKIIESKLKGDLNG